VGDLECPHCGKPIDDDLIGKHFAAKGGKANKKGKRPDLAKGGATYEKRWGNRQDKDGQDK
jgi:hypothetical protein